MTSAGATYALRQIAEKSCHNRDSYEEALDISKKTLLQEFNTNLVPTDPINETQVSRRAASPH